MGRIPTGNHPRGNIDGGKRAGSQGSQGSRVMGGFPRAIIHPGSIDGGKRAGERREPGKPRDGGGFSRSHRLMAGGAPYGPPERSPGVGMIYKRFTNDLRVKYK